MRDVKLTKITGESLVLKYNPDGGLSSAQLDGQNVIQEIKSVKYHSCEVQLGLFGFKQSWPKEQCNILKELNSKLASVNLSILLVEDINASYCIVCICDLRDPMFIYRNPKLMAKFDFNERKFVKVVKQYVADNKYTKLIKGI